MKDPHDIIIRPLLSEKSYDNFENKKYTFAIAIDANRTEVKNAVQAVFDVKVKKVNIVRVLGKMKRQGRTEGRRPSYKKAYVTLTEDSKPIEFFEGMAH